MTLTLTTIVIASIIIMINKNNNSHLNHGTYRISSTPMSYHFVPNGGGGRYHKIAWNHRMFFSREKYLRGTNMFKGCLDVYTDLLIFFY